MGHKHHEYKDCLNRLCDLNENIKKIKFFLYMYYWSFQGDTSLVVRIVLCFGVFVLFAAYARFHILVKFW